MRAALSNTLFDAKTTTIIARGDVVQKDGTKAVLKLAKFEMLSQGAFPEAGVKPIVGDEVIMNYLYDRALIVVPNANVFRDITKKLFGHYVDSPRSCCGIP